ncbi:hypothetical protein H4W33_009108 [Kibdelosporangium phytohabitans]|nr:hypothetical protein [Kibdelosporangium phytohabitans]
MLSDTRWTRLPAPRRMSISKHNNPHPPNLTANATTGDPQQGSPPPQRVQGSEAKKRGRGPQPRGWWGASTAPPALGVRAERCWRGRQKVTTRQSE